MSELRPLASSASATPARGRRGPAQPLARKQGVDRAKRLLSQEHPDDRPHRRRQDRDQPPPGQARPRHRSSRSSHEIHRGWGYVGRDVENKSSAISSTRRRSWCASTCAKRSRPAPMTPPKSAGDRGAGRQGRAPRDQDARCVVNKEYTTIHRCRSVDKLRRGRAGRHHDRAGDRRYLEPDATGFRDSPVSRPAWAGG